MEPTREQLQTEILEILYQKSLQKPTMGVLYRGVLEYRQPESV